MIFSYLTPTEIAGMRLMSSNIAAIGLEYIATTVTLTLQEDSFDRLLDIAHHPVVSKSVRNLHYERGSFSRLPRATWEDSILTPYFAAPQPDLGTFYEEPPNVAACNVYTKKQLNQAFSAYQKHCAEEDRARRSGFYLNKFINAVQHFPNLQTIYMLSGSCSRYSAKMAKILKGASYHQQIILVHNIAVVRSILVAVDRVVRDSQIMNSRVNNVDNGPGLIARSQDPSTASDNHLVRNEQVIFGPGDGTSSHSCLEATIPEGGQSILRVKRLVLEEFDWSLTGLQIFSIMERSLSHLTRLEVQLLNRSLKMNNPVHEFVKSAPGLEEFSVSVSHGPNSLSVGLPDIVGSFHWISLKTVHFSKILIDADNLQEFCSRHSSMLSNFYLGDVFMERHAHVAGRIAWYSMFTKITETTNLEKARVYGCLSNEQDEYYMDDRPDDRRASGTLIGRYLVGEGGRSSLKDFMRDERRRILRQDRSSSFNDTDTEWSNS